MLFGTVKFWIASTKYRSEEIKKYNETKRKKR